MAQNYAYFKYDVGHATPSGKTRGEEWHEESFQDYIANTGRDRESKEVLDPATGKQSTKMVQVNEDDKVVTIRCANFVDHPTDDERCYLIDDTAARGSLFSLNNVNYINASKKTAFIFEEKTEIELEALGFVFDQKE